MKKRLFSLALCLALVFSIFAAVNVTASAETYNGFEYYVWGDSAEITAYNGTDKKITIPSKINGMTVTEIGFKAFAYNETITEVVIPSTVEYIYSWAFEGCTSLKSVTIGEGVSYLGTCAFFGCTSLSSITLQGTISDIGEEAFYNTAYYNNQKNWQNGVLYIGNHLISGKLSTWDEDAYEEKILTEVKGDYTVKSGTTTIAESAFYNCNQLTGITIPSSVKVVGDYTFSWSENLKKVTLNNGIEQIGYGAFYSCTLLTTVNIPKSVYYLASDAFCDCTSLTSITVDSANEYYTAKDGVLFDKEVYSLICYPAGKTNKSYTTPNTVTSIESSAFINNIYLTSVVIPDSVLYIGSNAFENCEALADVTLGKKIDTIGTSTFANTAIKSIKIPESVTYIGHAAFGYCENLADITIGDKIEIIGHSIIIDTAYYNNLNNWTDGVLYLGNYLISGKLSTWDEDTYEEKILTEVKGDYTVKDGTKLIAPSAFESCEKLTGITIADGVTFIGDDAFADCGIKKASIPGSVTEIDESAFSYCDNLTEVTLAEGIEVIEYNAFYDCPNLKSVTVPKSVESIGGSAFGYTYDEETYDEEKVSDFVLNCYQNSAAHDYAIEYGINYKLLDAESEVGDVNCDGKINTKDVLLLRKYIAKWDVSVDLIGADCNADGKINTKDVLLLRKYLAKWPVILGKQA